MTEVWDEQRFSRMMSWSGRMCQCCHGSGWSIMPGLPCTRDDSDLIGDLKRWYYSGVPTKDDCLLRYLRHKDPYYVKHHETQLAIELGQMERRVD